MKFKEVVFLLLFILVLSESGNAQKIKLKSGNFTELKGQKSFGLKFTYDSMVIGENLPEDQYLEKKKMDWNLKEEGRAAAFVTQWYEDRKQLYEPAFAKGFDKFSRKWTLDKDSKFTIILKTKRTEGGWNAGVVSHAAEIDGELWIVESENEGNIIVRIVFYDVKGKISNGGDFEMTTRIQSAYQIAGELLGFYLKRKIK